MADTIPRTMSAATMSKWYLLAEERSRHFDELHRTGRWRRYYTQEQFAAHIDEAAKTVRMWQQMMEFARAVAAPGAPEVADAADRPPTANLN
jgi:uncharacterized repeat protein (TIGR03809 family)